MRDQQDDQFLVLFWSCQNVLMWLHGANTEHTRLLARHRH